MKKKIDPFDYIAKMINEKGEIVINNVDYDDYNEDDYDEDLCVLCYDHYTGKPMNIVVDRIKEHSIVGRESGSIFTNQIEVRSCDWGGNTPKWIAEKVAESYEFATQYVKDNMTDIAFELSYRPFNDI